MVRFGLLVVLVGSVGLAFAQEPKQPGTAVIAIDRSGGGFLIPGGTPPSHYSFTVEKDGAWEMKFGKGESKKGKLGADEALKWAKDIQDGGFDKLKSNPALGAADEPFMTITLRVGDKAEQKKIRLEEKLAQAIEKKVVEVTRPGK